MTTDFRHGAGQIFKSPLLFNIVSIGICDLFHSILINSCNPQIFSGIAIESHYIVGGWVCILEAGSVGRTILELDPVAWNMHIAVATPTNLLHV